MWRSSIQYDQRPETVVLKQKIKHVIFLQLINMGNEIVQLLKTQTCYDLLPLSYKLIVLETTLLVRKGLAALLQHGMLAG
jgi:hypothetical protein